MAVSMTSSCRSTILPSSSSEVTPWTPLRRHLAPCGDVFVKQMLDHLSEVSQAQKKIGGAEVQEKVKLQRLINSKKIYQPAIAGCRERHVRCAEGSADFLTPSPPAKKKKTTARQDQAEQPASVPSGIGKVENQRVTRC